MALVGHDWELQNDHDYAKLGMLEVYGMILQKFSALVMTSTLFQAVNHYSVR